MTKNPNINTILTTVAAAALAGITAYTIFKTLKIASRLDELDLDFGNDDVLSSLFNQKEIK